MKESSASVMPRWRYGMQPKAIGMRIGALGRVDLPIGEALRVEMVGGDPAEDDLVHVQYYIATEAGGWALWTSCSRVDVPVREAALRLMTSPSSAEA